MSDILPLVPNDPAPASSPASAPESPIPMTRRGAIARLCLSVFITAAGFVLVMHSQGHRVDGFVLLGAAVAGAKDAGSFLNQAWAMSKLGQPDKTGQE